MLDGDKPSLGDILSAASGQWRERLGREMERLGQAGSTPATADVLRHLPPAGLAQSELTTRVGLTKQAVQQLVDRLESGGAVRREADATDKRMKRVIPTALGLAQLEARRAAERGLEEDLRGSLGKKGYSRFRKALKGLAAP